MLEGIVSSLLAKYLGDYVEGLEQQNLKLGFLGGDVELHNLMLKVSALDDLDLPIIVKSGFLGSIIIQIPWKNLGSQPTIVRLSNVFVVVSPMPRDRASAGRDPEAKRKKKQKKISFAELFRKKGTSGNDNATKEASSSSEPEGTSFAQRMAAKVVDNLQVFIDKVHVRYEDDRTNPEKPFAFGVTLEHLHAQSADESFHPTFLTNSVAFKIIHKLVRLSNLAVYWDSGAEFVSFDSTEELGAKLDKMVIHRLPQCAMNLMSWRALFALPDSLFGSSFVFSDPSRGQFPSPPLHRRSHFGQLEGDAEQEFRSRHAGAQDEFGL